ncbi:MAG: hypothetical protein ABFE01_13550, partial [Phycisphaerales bacterium]
MGHSTRNDREREYRQGSDGCCGKARSAGGCLRGGGLILTMIALALAPCASAGASASPDVSRATLDNGLQVVVVRSPLASVVTTIMNYLVGSNEAPEGFPGMAHA